MALHLNDQGARIEGRVGAEECQDLLDWLRQHERGPVDLAECEHLHTAALQCLLVFHPAVNTLSKDPWLNHVLAHLERVESVELPMQESPT